MHPSTMLREQVFTVEFAPTSGFAALAEFAHPSCQTEMLRGDMAFPFVLGGECGDAACKGEDACVWPCVCCCYMACQSSGGVECGAEGAGGALKCSLCGGFGFGLWFGDFIALCRWLLVVLGGVRVRSGSSFTASCFGGVFLVVLFLLVISCCAVCWGVDGGP